MPSCGSQIRILPSPPLCYTPRPEFSASNAETPTAAALLRLSLFDSMLARWPIRNKLLLGITLLLVIVGTLSLSGFVGVYAYRGLVKSLRSRADELPLATALSQQISDLRAVLVAANAERLSGDVLQSETTHKLIEEEFQALFLAVENTLAEYRQQIATNDDERIGDTEQELGTASEIEQSLSKVAALTAGSSWGIDRAVSQQLNLELERVQTLTAQLPSHLHRRLGVLAGEVRASIARSLPSMRSPRF